MLFSIIVPIYKVEEYLTECIESILKQTFSEFELILVDDGSPDLCPSICDKYAQRDSRILVIHKKNGGLVSARKAGIEKATGQYIINVDSDDYIDETMLEKMASIINNYNPDMIAFDYWDVDEYDKKLRVVENKIAEGYYSKTQLCDLYGSFIYDKRDRNHNTGSLIYSIWSKVVKKSVLINHQMTIPNEFKRGEDLALVMSTISDSVESLYIYHDALYCYRQRENSMVHTFSKEDIERYLTLYKFLLINAKMIDRQNLNGYIFRVTLANLIDAAKEYEKYKLFRDYCSEVYSLDLKKIIDEYSQPSLLPHRKVRVFLIKKQLWWLFWLIYRK